MLLQCNTGRLLARFNNTLWITATKRKVIFAANETGLFYQWVILPMDSPWNWYFDDLQRRIIYSIMPVFKRKKLFRITRVETKNCELFPREFIIFGIWSDNWNPRITTGISYRITTTIRVRLKGYAYALTTWDKRFINVLEDFMVPKLKI